MTTNMERLEKLIKKYDEDLTAKDYRYFAPDVLRYCGSIVMKKVEEEFGTFISYYRDRYVIIDDVVFSTDKKELVRYSPEKTDESYVIPDYVETIRDGAFQGSEHLERVTISKNIRHIGSRAFADSSNLAEIVLPKNVTSIGSRVFMNCKELASATFENANTVLDNECFKGCHNDLIIKASSGGTVEEYAHKYNIKFEAI